MDRALLFLFRSLADLFMMVILLRLFLQWFRANFRNPVAQAIVRMTSPVVVPLRRILPPIGPIDTATAVVAVGFQVLFVALLAWIFLKTPLGPMDTLGIALVRTVLVGLRLLFFAILIFVLLSWVSPQAYNPIRELLGSVAEPLLRPARRIIPPIAGLDLSPIAVLLLLQATIILVSQAIPYNFA